MLPTLWLPEITIRQPHFVTTAAFTLIEGILTGQIAGPLPSSVILTAAQIAQIQAAVNSYNAIIAVEAQSHGAALVNIHGILNLIQARESSRTANGALRPARHVTPTYVTFGNRRNPLMLICRN